MPSFRNDFEYTKLSLVAGFSGSDKYTATSKVWAPTLFYTKTCNSLKESNFFSRLQIFLKLENCKDRYRSATGPKR